MTARSVPLKSSFWAPMPLRSLVGLSAYQRQATGLWGICCRTFGLTIGTLPTFSIRNGISPSQAYRVFDTIVLGRNPVLNSLAALSLARRGQKALIITERAIDHWPYQLLGTKPMQSLTTQVARLDMSESDAKALSSSLPTAVPLSALNAELTSESDGREFFTAIGQALRNLHDHDGFVANLPRGYTIKSGGRHSLEDGEAYTLFYLRKQAKGDLPPFEDTDPPAPLLTEFGSAVERVLSPLKFRPFRRPTDYERSPRTVLAKRLVLTSNIDAFGTPTERPDGFALNYDEADGITALGSARGKVAEGKTVISWAIEDVIAAANLGRELDD
ncbi:MAG: hypothetical protein KI792_10940 [Alphaproteobacteria bacterium]|nr:hypothetical protein [Alphaproteobacteria bacterium SS10]